MGLQFPVRRGFGAVEEVWYDPSTWAEDDGSSDSSSDTLNAEEGLFNSPEDEFFSYSGPDLEDDGSVSTAVEDSASSAGAWWGGGSTTTGSTLASAAATDSGDWTDGFYSEEKVKAAYAFGYERGKGDKMTGKPADPSAAIATVGELYADAAASGYADGYAGAPSIVDPKKKTTGGGGTTADKKTEEGMSTAAKVGIALGIGGLVAVGVMAASKKKRGR